MNSAVDLLGLLLFLGRDRSRVGLGKQAALRREFAAWLAVRDMSYSQLLDRIHPRFASDSAQLDATLARVAHFMEPRGEDDTGVYRLRDECWADRGGPAVLAFLQGRTCNA